MTTQVDIVNRALQTIGTRTTVASLNENSNEAIQANLIINQLRDDLMRMAPWSCGLNYQNLVYITSAPGTPENPTLGTTTWNKGQPPPPWAYEYQYPVDCLKALWIVPQFLTGFASGVPITTAVTGGAPSFWNGPPVRFKVALDQFFSIGTVAVVSPGSGHVAGDFITLAGTPQGQVPIGAPAVLQVTATGGGGAITNVATVPNVVGSVLSGSYFQRPTAPIAQGSTTGVGTGATFTYTAVQQGDQRVILTNQEQGILCYVRQVTDVNVMDPLFIDAWTAVLGARLVYSLTGDKQLANMKIGEANNMITEARKADGNEGLTINDVTPDWIRQRGIYYTDWEYSPNVQYDWGAMFTPY